MPKATFYAQFTYAPPRANYGGAQGELKFKKATTNKPTDPQGDLTVKFTVEIPDAMLVPEVAVKLDPTGAVNSVVESLKKTAKELQP